MNKAKISARRSILGRKYTSLRIRPELRAAQVKRSINMTPALTLFFDEKYDLGNTPLPENFVKVGLLECLFIIARSDADVLEVPEPLWIRFLPRNAVILLTWKVFGLLRSRRRIAVTYAIENNDLAHLLSPNGRVPESFINLAGKVAGCAISIFIDRIAFGSSTAMAVYHSMPTVAKLEHILCPELPAPRVDLAQHTSTRKSASKVVFVGELDDRKGILELIEAWTVVERTLPSAELEIVGSGVHSDFVSRWVSQRPLSRNFRGLLPHDEVAIVLEGADVLVAPSKRSGRWREQIGLPIVEALSTGLTVVTTDETGLASWLSENRHIVMAEDELALRLAPSLLNALASPLQREEVLDSLPAEPGRLRADAWLHGRNGRFTERTPR